jgi:toxin YhaV
MAKEPFSRQRGWDLYLYSAFKQPYDTLVAEIDQLAKENPKEYACHAKAKLLKRINEIILDEVPSNPGNPLYRQGNTLGAHYKDWFHVKFLGRFRLFFKYNTKAKLIIYCWVNDETTLRKTGAETDPYKIFARMIKSGRPPNSWADLEISVLGEK